MKTSKHLDAVSLFLRLGIVAAALFVLNTAGAIGAVYYVATDGSDTTGNGSTETPWATITHALDMVEDEDIIAKNNDFRDDIIEKPVTN